MTSADPTTILPDDEGPAAEVVNPGGPASICLLCEHASRFIPSPLGGLGLDAEAAESHAAWDIGAAALSQRLAEAMDAPLVAARVSRLVYDCNRPPEAPDAMPARTEAIEIPGNRDLPEAERRVRTEAIYRPFEALVERTLDALPEGSALITVHSFTPVWFGKPRATEIGLLHDADDRLAKAMLAHAGDTFRTELNEPYSAADGVTHSLKRHALPRGMPNVMIEVRNDLLRDAGAVSVVADALLSMLRRALPEVRG